MVAVPLVAYGAVSHGSEGGRLPVAVGSPGPSLHPLAGDFRPDQTILGACDGESACLEQAFGNISFREGPRAALSLFDQRIAADAAVEKGCHRIAHWIGSGALARFEGNVARTFSLGSPTCVSGYYHGILERAFLGAASKAQLAERARSICLEGGMRRRGFLDYQCRHGLGHGLMIQTGYDLPLALSICKSLGTGWDHKACAGGAFMENLDTRFGYRSSWLDDEDPLYPCRRVAAVDKRSCYLRASWRIHTLEKGDHEATVATCAGLGVWAGTCFNGYGRDVAELSRYAPEPILERCEAASSGESDCVLGAARTIANANGARGIAPAVALCRTASEESLRAACFSGVGIVLGMVFATAATRRAACATHARRYVDPCFRAATTEVDPSGRYAWG